ncbi:hypothetical protein RND81_08G121300 [Saponaria officinalis]|uniref:Uncharacterized protein n=1 Tax=Saponaria officinalis TaxID=3572 RepID=A0AAW1J7F8_SAPOF
MQFCHEGRHQVLKGVEFFAISLIGEGQNHEDRQMLELYSKVFEVPSGLSPLREGSNHKILLKTNVEPVNIRPYRYLMAQKDVIEANLGVTRRRSHLYRTSLYASPRGVGEEERWKLKDVYGL